MNKELILQKITSLAKEIRENKEFVTRADIAYELRDLGVETDSIQISSWILDAASRNPNEKGFAQMLSNDGRETLLSLANKITAIATGYEAFVSIMKGDSQGTEAALDQVTLAIKKLEDFVPEIMQTSLLQKATGTSGVAKTKSEAGQLYSQYTEMTNYYTNAKGAVQGIIQDFVHMRDLLMEKYYLYVMTLIDIFGDSIKSADPKVFDFDKVEYLDVQSMQSTITLELNKFLSKSQALIQEIGESFTTSVRNSAQLASGLQGNALKGVAVVSEMMGHYLASINKTASLKEDLIMMRRAIKKDTAEIVADLTRLKSVFEIIRDVYLPSADLFHKHSGEIFDHKFARITEELYSTPELKALREQRLGLLKELNALNAKLSDTQGNIAHYQKCIDENNDLLRVYEKDYIFAQESKPKKFLFATTSYNKKMYDWSNKYMPVIEMYEGFKVDIAVDTKEKGLLEKELKLMLKERETLLREMRVSSEALKSRIKTDEKVKTEVLKDLSQIVALLRINRNIIESGLDPKLCKVVKVPDMTTEIADATHSISMSSFYQENKALILNPEAHLITPNRELSPSEETYVQEYNYEVQEMLGMADQVLSQATLLVDNLQNLAILRQEEEIESERYEQELTRIQADFDSLTQDTKVRAVVIKHIYKHIDSTSSPEQKYELLKLLTNSDVKGISNKEWEDFLNGTADITI